MSMTEEEARYEQWMEELYDEHREQAIEEFTTERLQSYYVDNPMVAEAALRSLAEARNLLPQHPTAAHIFAAIAIELGLKVTLFKPVVYGLVHSDSVAGVITDLVIGRTGVERFRNLLFKILSEYGGVDLEKFKRTESKKSLWEEIQVIQQRRNKIIHKAEIVTDGEAKQAIEVASALLEELFPSVIRNLGLHVRENGRVATVSAETEARVSEMRTVLNKYTGQDKPPK